MSRLCSVIGCLRDGVIRVETAAFDQGGEEAVRFRLCIRHWYALLETLKTPWCPETEAPADDA